MAKAFQVSEENNLPKYEIIETNIPEISDDTELVIKALYSSLNYKDFLSCNIHKGITRNYPHIPGVDVAGIVVKSKNNNFKEGDEVIVTGYDLGMNTKGGWQEYVKIPVTWVVKKPDNLTLKQVMIFGTAGFTAMLSLRKILLNINSKKNSNILITGSSGGVGSIATLLAQELGFKTSCLTRHNDKFIESLSPDKIILLNDFNKDSGKPLENREYIAAIDNLGGDILKLISKKIDYHGAIALCGNILGNNLNSSSFPFILRGISLLGIASANTEMQERKIIWEKLANSKINLDNIYQEITLTQIPSFLEKIKQGKNKGRILLKI